MSGCRIPFGNTCEKNRSRRAVHARRERGIGRADVLVALLCIVISFSAAMPVIGRTGSDSGEMRSLANLRTLASAHEAYAQSFGGRQWTAIPEDAGLVSGNCGSYLSVIACPPQMLLGQSPSSSAWWGYYLGNTGLCAGLGWPGNCGNWTMYRPLSFAGSDSGMGSYRVPNVVSFNSFVDGRFYSDTFYSPNDRLAYGNSAKYRDQGVGFDFVAGEPIAFSTYCLSPAAMYNPEVLAAANGGFRNPNSFVEGYVSPPVAQCTYPDLKTRMIEHHWTVGAPSFANTSTINEYSGWIFNASQRASPNAVFFDGRIGRIANADAMADDAARQASEGIGLWSRTTPFGASGYRGPNGGSPSPEGTTTSHTILTLDGILGRDLLSVR
jgi:hypothetical protein